MSWFTRQARMAVDATRKNLGIVGLAIRGGYQPLAEEGAPALRREAGNGPRAGSKPLRAKKGRSLKAVPWGPFQTAAKSRLHERLISRLPLASRG